MKAIVTHTTADKRSDARLITTFDGTLAVASLKLGCRPASPLDIALMTKPTVRIVTFRDLEA